MILHESNASHQSIRTWKESDNAELEKKKRRIEWLVGQPHILPVGLRADEIGPIQLIPQRGEGWLP